MKKLFKAALVMMMMACVLVAGCGGDAKKDAKPAADAGAADKKVELKLAYHLPTNHPLSKGVEKFVKNVKEKSKGSIDIKVFPAGQLYTDKTMNDALMSGGVDMGLNTVGRWATIIPAMEIFDVPFMFPDYAKVDKAIDGGLGEKLTAELKKKNVVPVIWADYGFVQFQNAKKAITKPSDFAGLKIRGYSAMSSETIKALGASPVTMGAAEVYMSIQRGVIDGQTSGTSAVRDRKVYEVTKYLTMTNHAYPEFILAMNAKSYDKLSANQKKIFDAEAKAVQDELRANSKNEDLAAMEDLKKKGMEVYIVPESELQAWRDATKPVYAIYEQHAGALGKELIDICLKIK